MSFFVSRRRRDVDLDSEIRTHLDMAIAERMARGESRADAERAVHREFGNVGHIKEVTRGAWGSRAFDELRQDIRFGIRSLLHAPGFTAAAVLTIALGIGITTATFTIVNGILLRPLPFKDPEQLVAVSYGPRSQSGEAGTLTDSEFLELRDQPTPFASVTTFSTQLVALTSPGEPVRTKAAMVTPEFLDVLGVPPRLGPGFRAGRDLSNAQQTVLIGEALWRSQFGADSQVVGSEATINGTSRTIVGVMPPNFTFPGSAELWIPLEVRAANGNSGPVIARLREHVTLEQARSRFAALAATFSRRNAESPAAAQVIPLKTQLVGDVSQALMLLSGAAALVLLIACTNVSNLLLMRAGIREREIAVRSALGAGRRRLIRQLLTESILIACAGGAAGTLFAIGGVKAVLRAAPPGVLPRIGEIEVDGAVLAFSFAMIITAGIAFGLAPAIQSSRPDVQASLTEGARTHSARPGRLRGVLVAVQLGLSLMLLAGAGLLVRSFQQIRSVRLGFRPENVMTLSLQLPSARYTEARAMQGFHAQIIDGLARIPGAEAAAAVNWRPLGDTPSGDGIRVEGQPVPPAGYRPYKVAVSPSYFRAMGIAVRRGRGFRLSDDLTGAKVVVISQSLADRFWHGGNSIGERISLSSRATTEDWREVVGIVDDVAQKSILTGVEPVIYQPLAQVTQPFFLGTMNYVVRMAKPVEGAASAARLVVRQVDPQLPVHSLSTMDAIVLSTVGDRLFQLRILSVFSALALVLAAVGVYGVMAYSVAERRHEFGIRLALGARRRHITQMVLWGTMRLVIPGVALGALGSIVTTKVFEGVLFQVSPTDPVTFGTVAAGLVIVALVAAVIPACGAARVDPAATLKG